MKKIAMILFYVIILTVGSYLIIQYRQNLFMRLQQLLTKFSGQIENNIENEPERKLPYKIVGTNQTRCYDYMYEMECPESEALFYGQDAQYASNTPSYQDNGDGTITDNVTGLMWQQDSGEGKTYQEAIEDLKNFQLGGYTDWRIPTIKELYSLIEFSGTVPVGVEDPKAEGLVPFIDKNYFKFGYNKPEEEDGVIDSKWVTNTIYTSKVMDEEECFFGVDFAYGRIECYPINEDKKYFAMYVRGDNYGISQFFDNGNNTISDKTTGLMWMKQDNGDAVEWETALKYCENLNLSGYSDWRAPTIKELHSIVDYSRSPDLTGSAAIDPSFEISEIQNEAGKRDYPYFWSSTSHVTNFSTGGNAAYISFGRTLGFLDGKWIDVHGAGAQHSDLKIGNNASYPEGRGAHGDAVRIKNYVRCVRKL